ncbi:MAG: ribosomal protein S18-alanine N-acetyltransferase [Saccharofermentans sp.]|nr:ribosomal protein S18-alanine N-acetyltransferase [Saccharofermentans sp.]
MADIVIRPGTLSDVNAVMALEQGSIEHPWESKAVETLITDPNKMCLIAELDGTVAAYVGAESVLDESNIGNIVTHKAFRGRGIATRLFNALLEELKAQGITKVFLEVEHDNAPAIALYKRSGFADYGYRRDYYGPGKDAVLMSLDL